jgi:hypothetical protein
MSEDEILKISERLCELGLLKCMSIVDGLPRYELTLAGWIAIMRMEEAGK